MNPDLENTVAMRPCPMCEGRCVLYPNEPMLRVCCPNCGGDGVVPVDEADVRDDAAEARREAGQGK